MPIAWLAKGCAARGVSARELRDHRRRGCIAKLRRGCHRRTVELYLLGLPLLLSGLWIGLKPYGKLDDAAFRKVILLLLLLSGLALVVPMAVIR